MDQITQYLAQPWIGQGLMVIIGLIVLVVLLRVSLAWFKAIMESRQQQPVQAVQAAQQTAPAKPTETSARMGWNMRIAKTHETATQVIAIQIAGANLLAIAVSACSVVGGMVVLASQQYPGNYVFMFVAGGVGLGLAVLIEGITISSLIRIRNAGPAIRTAMAKWEAEFDAAKQQDAQRYYSDKQYRTALNRDFADRKKRYVKPHEKKRGASIPFAFLGAVASATAGGLFYHNILQGLQAWVAFAISGLLAVVVTGTFVSQELFREDQEEAIREGFKGGSLTLAAIKEEAKRISMQEIYSSLQSYMQSEEARTTINGKLLQMLTKALDDITDTTINEFKQPILEAKKQTQATVDQTVITGQASTQREPVIEVEASPAPAPITSDDQVVINESQDEGQSDVQERDTDAINVVAARSEAAALDYASEYKDVIINYPGVAQAWLAKGVKSVSVEDVIAATGHSKQRVVYHAKRAFAKTPKNPNLYTVVSVLKWLQTAKLPTGNTVEVQAVSSNGNGHNGHHNGETPSYILNAQLEEIGVN